MLVSQHPEVKAVTSDTRLVRASLLESKSVSSGTDDEFHPFAKPEQTTIILRDVSANATLADVEALFS